MRGFRILAVALLAGCSSSPSTETARTGPQPEPEKPAAAGDAAPAPSDIPVALVTLYEWWSGPRNGSKS